MVKKFVTIMLLFLFTIMSVNAYDYFGVIDNTNNADIIYNFDEGSGKIVNDLTGKNIDMIVNSGTWTTDVPNSNYQYSIKDLNGDAGFGSVNMRKGDGMTFSIWWKPTSISTSTTDHRFIVHSRYNSVEGLYLDQYNSVLRFYIKDDAGNIYDLQVPFDSQYLNTWTHITLVLDKVNLKQKIYINGVEKGSLDLNAGATFSELNLMRVGAYYNNDYNNAGYLTGLKFLAKPLTANDITNLYNNGGEFLGGNVYLDNFNGIFFQTNTNVNFKGRIDKLAELSYSLDGGAYTQVGTGNINSFDFTLTGIADGEHIITFKTFDGSVEKSFTTKFYVKADYDKQTISTCPSNNVNDFTEYIWDSNMYLNANPCFNLPDGATYIKINGNGIEHITFNTGTDANPYLVYLNGKTNGVDISNFNLQNMRYDQTGKFDRTMLSMIVVQTGVKNKKIENLNVHDNYFGSSDLVFNFGGRSTFGTTNVGVHGVYYENIVAKNNAWNHLTRMFYLKDYSTSQKTIQHINNLVLENIDWGSSTNAGTSAVFFDNDYNQDYITNAIFRNLNYWAVYPNKDYENPVGNFVRFPVCSDIVWENVNFMSSNTYMNDDANNDGITDNTHILQDSAGCVYQNDYVKTLTKVASTTFPNYQSAWLLNVKNPTFGLFTAGNTYYPTYYLPDRNNYDKYLSSIYREGIKIDYRLIRNPEVYRLDVTANELQIDGSLSYQFEDGTWFGGLLNLPSDYDAWMLNPTFSLRTSTYARTGSTAPLEEFQVQISDPASDFTTDTRDNHGLISIDDNSVITGLSYRHTGNGNHYLIGNSNSNIDTETQDGNTIIRNRFYYTNSNEGRGIRLTGSNNKVMYNYFQSNTGGVRYYLDIGGYNNDSGVSDFTGTNNLIFGNYFVWRAGGTMTSPTATETYILYGSADATFINNKFYDDYNNNIQIFDENTLYDLADKTNVKLNGLYDYVYNGQIYTFNIGNYWEDYSASCTDANADDICDDPYTYDGITDNYPIKQFPFDFKAHLNLAIDTRPLNVIDIWTNQPEVGKTYFINDNTPSVPIIYYISGGEGQVDCNIYIDDSLYLTQYDVNISNTSVSVQNTASYVPDTSGAHTIQFECHDQYTTKTSNVEGFYTEIQGEETPTLILTRPTDGALRQVTSDTEQIYLGFLHNIVDNNATCDLYIDGVQKISGISGSEANVEYLIDYPYSTADAWIDGHTYTWSITCSNFEQAGVTEISAQSSFTINIVNEVTPFVDINIPQDGEVYTLATSTDTIPFSADIKLSADSICKAYRDDIVVGVQSMPATGSVVSFNHITGWVNKAYTSKITCENDIDGVLSSVLVSYNVIVGDESQPINVDLQEPAHQSVVQIPSTTSPVTFKFTQDNPNTDVCKVYVDGIAYATFNDPVTNEVIRADILAGWKEEPYMAYVYCYSYDLSIQGYSTYNTFYVQVTDGTGDTTTNSTGTTGDYEQGGIIDYNSVDKTNENTISFMGDIVDFMVNISVPAGIVMAVLILGGAFIRLLV